MSDKIEYSRLLVKRSNTPGTTPSVPPITATTLNDFTPTDLFVGEMFLNTSDDLLWVRTDNGIAQIGLTGFTGTTIPGLTQVLNSGNLTFGYDIIISSGDTIIWSGLPVNTPTYLLGTDSSGNTISVTPTPLSGGTTGQTWVDLPTTGTTTGATTIDWNLGNVQEWTLGANTNFSFSNGNAGGTYILIVRQSTGAIQYTVTWDTDIHWSLITGTPVMTNIAGRYDVYSFVYDGTRYFGTYSQNYNP